MDLTEWLWGWNVRVNGMRSECSFCDVCSDDCRSIKRKDIVIKVTWTKSTSYHSEPRENWNWRCSNTKSFTEFYQRTACYTKWKKVASPSCPFCPSECQTPWHLLINCTHASSFWNRLQEWYSICSNTKLLLSELEVMFWIIRCRTYCLALNHLIILGKYLLYVNDINTITYQFDHFVSLVRSKSNL